MTPSPYGALSDELEGLIEPICVVVCELCGGSGADGDAVVNEAPATWDDPGYYEVVFLPCECCGGTGYMEVEAEPRTLNDLEAENGNA